MKKVSQNALWEGGVSTKKRGEPPTTPKVTRLRTKTACATWAKTCLANAVFVRGKKGVANAV